jgi:putative oxidoreductase
MDTTKRWPRTALLVIVWVFSVVISLGIGVAGITKLHRPNRWEPMFAGWGYPAWFSIAVGVAEVGGAIALLIPGVALYAASLLTVIMVGALITLLRHPGGPFGWGATPAVYVVLLVLIGEIRRRQRADRDRP